MAVNVPHRKPEAEPTGCVTFLELQGIDVGRLED